MWIASVLHGVENLSEDKHVENLLVLRLDEGSTPSVSTIKSDQAVGFFVETEGKSLVCPTPSNFPSQEGKSSAQKAAGRV